MLLKIYKVKYIKYKSTVQNDIKIKQGTVHYTNENYFKLKLQFHYVTYIVQAFQIVI